VVMASHLRSVTPYYRTASIRWFAGEDIYGLHSLCPCHEGPF
jgi:hypothetical protein